jgi:hypothetical protein
MRNVTASVFTFLFRTQSNLNKLNKLNINNIKLNYKIKKIENNQNITNYNYNFFLKNFLNTKNNLTCFFLRKSKFFNKGRYSRNRQIYRTGVYLCFYVNIAVLYSIWFVFYKSSIKFTYLWWIFFMLPSSFIFSRALKYNLFFPKEFFFYMKLYFNWLVSVLGAIFFKK